MLPCGMPNSNRTGSDLEFEATTVWKRLVRKDDNDERIEDEISNQYFEVEYYDQYIVSNAAKRSRLVFRHKAIGGKMWMKSIINNTFLLILRERTC